MSADRESNGRREHTRLRLASDVDQQVADARAVEADVDSYLEADALDRETWASIRAEADLPTYCATPDEQEIASEWLYPDDDFGFDGDDW